MTVYSMNHLLPELLQIHHWCWIFVDQYLKLFQYQSHPHLEWTDHLIFHFLDWNWKSEIVEKIQLKEALACLIHLHGENFRWYQFGEFNSVEISFLN